MLPVEKLKMNYVETVIPLASYKLLIMCVSSPYYHYVKI